MEHLQEFGNGELKTLRKYKPCTQIPRYCSKNMKECIRKAEDDQIFNHSVLFYS